MSLKKKEWFKEWFDTKYYHILYQDRNDDEAQVFMKHLTSFLQLKNDSKILDLPCGRGRHSVYLNQLGYDVIGADLSENSVAFAKQFENETLNFEVHDMRDPFQTKFDAIFNLFTSFGYFDNEQTNIQVLENLKDGLKENGVLVIDFMNVKRVKQSIVFNEIISKNGIEFNIDRSVIDNTIIKDIRFLADGKEHHYSEKIKVLPLPILKEYFSIVGLQLKHTFGSYMLDDFDIENSSRLILILE